MANRFDQIVEEAVNEVQPTRRHTPRNRGNGTGEKVLPLDTSRERQDQSTAPATKREPKRTKADDATAALARGLTRPLVTKTVRFRPELAEAPNRIVLENKLAGRRPDTIQDLVNEATQAWVNSYKPKRQTP